MVRDAIRCFKILAALRSLWSEMPDMRFIQLFYYILTKFREYEEIDESTDLFYFEDNNVEEYLYRMLVDSKEEKRKAGSYDKE